MWPAFTLTHAPCCPPCCWQALRSLELIGAQQQHVAAAATLTQLTRLQLSSKKKSLAAINVSCLSALTGLQSLSLKPLQLTAPGLSLVARMAPPDWYDEEFSSLLELQWASFQLAPGAAGKLADMAADMRHLAACPVPCQALVLLFFDYPSTEQAVQLAAALTPLAPTVTGLYLFMAGKEGDETLELAAVRGAAVLSLCQALPQLVSLHIASSQQLPDLSDLPLHRPPLTSIILQSDSEPSHSTCCAHAPWRKQQPGHSFQCTCLSWAQKRWQQPGNSGHSWLPKWPPLSRG
jgi:hypothetical protein